MENLELLQAAIVELTIEKVTLRKELSESKISSDFWYDRYSKQKITIDALIADGIIEE